MSNINHVSLRVRLARPYGDFVVGREGTCTADLSEEGVYAVWFDEAGVHPLANDVKWIRFDHAAREAFDVVGPALPEVLDAMRAAKAALEARI